MSEPQTPPQIVDLFHDSLEPKDIHAPYSYVFNNQTERARAIVTQRDIGKLARQLEDGSIWLLWDGAPTWKRVLTEGVPTPPDGPAGGHLMKYYPNPEVRPDSHIHTPGLSIPAYPTSLPPNGPASGPDIEGYYPNLVELRPTGVLQGTYTNPTISIDEKGRVRQATSGVAGEVNAGLNVGSGAPIYKGKVNSLLQFRTLSPAFNSGLEVTLAIDELTFDSPGLAKLTGAEFGGPVSGPQFSIDNLSVRTLIKTLYQAGSGSNWIPEASNGSVQMREVIGSGVLGAIAGAPVGMEFRFYINVMGNYQMTLDTEYLLTGTNRSLTQGINVVEGYVLSPFMYDCTIRKGLV